MAARPHAQRSLPTRSFELYFVLEYYNVRVQYEEGVRAHVLYKISTAVCALKEAHACPWRRSDAGCTVSPEMMWTR
jgi:hypothetical protein